jgi:hypothetical protein
VPGDGTFSLTIALDRPAPSTAVFFPLEVSQVSESAPQKVDASGRQLRLTLRQSDQLTAVPRQLKGVLVFPDESAFVLAVPVGAGPMAPTAVP